MTEVKVASCFQFHELFRKLKVSVYVEEAIKLHFLVRSSGSQTRCTGVSTVKYGCKIGQAQKPPMKMEPSTRRLWHKVRILNTSSEFLM